ncbi:MAG: hypothetical protein R3178_10220 [Rhodothermales bacterium]|nr:hypothetical protein [Rhodothermales bacterium]
MKNSVRIVAAAIVLCLTLFSVSCSSDGYPGTSTVYVGVGYGGYGPGWGYGWGGGYYAPPPVIVAPPPIPDIPVAVPY